MSEETPAPTEEQALEKLLKNLKDWVRYKKAEKKAKASANAIAIEIQEKYGTSFEGKSKTFKEKELGFSINIKKNIVHKLDQELYKTVRLDIPAEYRPEKIVFELDEKGFEYLKKEKPEIYEKVSKCVEIKVNKPTITVEKK
jgi:hypothetical protein